MLLPFVFHEARDCEHGRPRSVRSPTFQGLADPPSLNHAIVELRESNRQTTYIPLIALCHRVNHPARLHPASRCSVPVVKSPDNSTSLAQTLRAICS